ncbi:mucin-2-like [Bombus pascuorum]|uniref:mucin-2-like n=1 Tax=Bombus pascuorum TaxID=65598 RepID=UPI00298D634F|nr:mucin-2-like [Bombus pascuorum]
MPSDCEINWREHRPSIKGRNIFGMILDSSSKHHTANMRLLLIALICLTASSALSLPKQKRNILPGDPRYGTSDHHHHENVVENARSLSDSYAQIPDTGYGPPEYEPSAPLNNAYLSPLGDVNSHSAPVLSYGVLDTVHVTQINLIEDRIIENALEAVNTYLVPEKTVPSSTVSVPVEGTATAIPPATSYGTPESNIKTTIGTGVTSQVKSTVTKVKTGVHDVSSSTVNVVKHVPVVKEVTRSTGTVQAPATVTTTIRKNIFGSGLLTETLPNTYTSYGGVLHVPRYDVSSHVPSFLYSPGFNSFDTLSTAYSRLNPVASDHQGINLDVPLPLSFKLQVSKNVPNTYSFPQSVEFPTTYHVPHSLTHSLVHHTQPLNTLYSSPSISSVESLSPAQHISSVETLSPLGSAHTVDTFTPVQSVETLSPPHLVHTVESVKSVETTPVQHTVHSIQSVPSVKTVGSLTPVEHTVHPVQSVTTVHPLESVETVTLHPLKSVEIVSPSQPVESYHTVSEVVKTSTPVVQSHVQLQKGPITDFFQNLNLSLPSFPSLPSLPSFPSSSSFFTFTTSPVSSTTVLPLVESSTPSSTLLASAYNQESIDTSLLHNDNLVKSVVTSSNEYVQPTDDKGGYIY